MILLCLLIALTFLIACTPEPIVEETTTEPIEETPTEETSAQPDTESEEVTIPNPEETDMEQMMENMQPGDMIKQDKELGNAMMIEMMKQMMNSEKYESAEDLPKIITTNFIELGGIQRVSRFRGGYGHDYSFGTDEECRSMKHYFWAQGEPGKPHNPSWMDRKYYAPTTGTIKNILTTTHEYGEEAQFRFFPSEQKNIYFGFFHIKLADGLGEGSVVQEGELLGTVGHEDTHAEIAVQVNGFEIYSAFDLMSEGVLREYTDRGLDLDKIKISREERDANPLECDTSTEEGRFIGGSIDGLTDSAGLSSFVELN